MFSCLRILIQESREPRPGCDEICQRLLEVILLRLRRRDDFTLSQIAQILGFSSLSHFSQSFRRLEGMSPMEYRRGRRDERSKYP